MFFESSACPLQSLSFDISRCKEPPVAVLHSVHWRGRQHFIEGITLGGFGGLMLRRTEFCSWCYSQLILATSKLLCCCTSLSLCLVHWGPDRAQISSCIKFVCTKLSKAVYFWKIEDLRLQENICMVNQKRFREEAKVLAP